MTQFKDYEHKGGAVFCAVAYPGILIVQKENRDGSFLKKTVRVEDDFEYTYKVMKTKIKAAGGSAGLLKFLEQCEKATDFWGSMVSAVYNEIIDNMKETKI